MTAEFILRHNLALSLYINVTSAAKANIAALLVATASAARYKTYLTLLKVRLIAVHSIQIAAHLQIKLTFDNLSMLVLRNKVQYTRDDFKFGS